MGLLESRRWPRLLITLSLTVGCQVTPARGPALPPGDYTPREENDDLEVPKGREDALREEALRRAKVWFPPARPVGEAHLDANPPGFLPSDEVDCKFLLKASEGTSPKFQCILRGGEAVKVKYGRRNAESFAEVAATRLLAALGFGADRMFLVARVRCFGCPSFPYPRVGLLDPFLVDYEKIREFEPAVIERRLLGKEIKGQAGKGWGFYDLDKIDPDRGASRAELDAFRLMAVFLAHWDSKAENHRLLCLPGGEPERSGEPCRAPLAMLQDVGQTFGPRGVDLEHWSGRPVWADPATCRVSMKDLPHAGATFQDTVISEGGRKLLGDLLVKLREDQLRALFTSARFAEYVRQSEVGRDVGNWVRAFQDKVRQIADRQPCPTP